MWSRRSPGARSVLRRYLAVEGHRAVAAQEGLLPAVARGLVDPELAACFDSPSAFAGARLLGDAAVAEPPAVFSTIPAGGQLRPEIDRPATAGQNAQAAARAETTPA